MVCMCVCVRASVYGWLTALYDLQAFLVAAPRLRCILTNIAHRTDVKLFGDFVDRAEEAGVEEIQVYLEGRVAEAHATTKAPTRWLAVPGNLPSPVAYMGS